MFELNMKTSSNHIFVIEVYKFLSNPLKIHYIILRNVITFIQFIRKTYLDSLYI